jgi:hypothetical protein
MEQLDSKTPKHGRLKNETFKARGRQKVKSSFSVAGKK